MDWISVVVFQIRKSFLVLAVLQLERPVLGLLVYGCVFLTAAVSSRICWKHFKSGRRIVGCVSLVIAGASWWAFYMSMSVLLATILWLSRQ